MFIWSINLKEYFVKVDNRFFEENIPQAFYVIDLGTPNWSCRQINDYKILNVRLKAPIRLHKVNKYKNDKISTYQVK